MTLRDDSWTWLLVVIVLVGPTVLGGCDSADPDEPGSVSVVLRPMVDASTLTLNELQYVNAAGNRYSVTRLEYILSEVMLIQDDGTRVLLASAHYSTLADEATHRFTTDAVPSGAYTGFAFTFGLRGDVNVLGSLPNTAAYNNMTWPAQLGGGTERYHYMRLEGRYQKADTTMSTFLVHTGPTGGEDNSISLTLPLNLDVSSDGGEITLEMNVSEWFTNPTTYDFSDYEGRIMGNQPAQTLLRANGASVFSVHNTSAN